MKIAGIALMWIGIIMLLKNMFLIEVIDWSIVWPVLVIIVGSSIKCGACGACGGKMCAEKCEGGKCCK